MSDILTVKDVADILGIGGHGVRWLIREGKLKAKRCGPAHMPGRCWYEIRRSDLEKFVRRPPGRPAKNVGTQ